MNTPRAFFIGSLFILAILLPRDASAEDQLYCTMQYDPVCGAKPVQCITTPCYPQYKTYGNACVMASEGATLIHKGECTPEESGPVKTAPTSTSSYTPPASCRTWYDGCNNCARMGNGEAACTKRYCAEPTAGFCTTYISERLNTTLQNDGSSSSISSSTLDIEDQEDFRPFSFLKRAWLHFLSWFWV